MPPQYNYLIPDLFGYKDQLAPHLKELRTTIDQSDDKESLINDILREIDDIHQTNANRDPSSSKAVAIFLAELLESYPMELLQSLHYIFNYLELENYMMRNASLEIMGELIEKILHKEDQDKKLRDEVLEAIFVHIKDVNSWTRSKALKVWCKLCEEGCIPLDYVTLVTNASVNRLKDKACSVRRNGLKFIVNIIGRNPFGLSKLPLTIFAQKYEVEKAALDKLKEDEKAEEVETLSQSSTVNSESTKEGSDAGHKEVVISPVEQKQKVVDYLHRVVAFIKAVHRAIPLVLELLYSKNTTDVQEAIDFFVTCNDFGIEGAVIGFKRMILLIDAEDASTRNSISLAYKRIFFDTLDQKSKEKKESQVVTKFINFVKLASIGECLALQNLMAQFLADKDFNKEMEDWLWGRFSKATPNTTVEDSIAAVQLLGMVASTKPKVIGEKIDWCIKFGLASKGDSEEDSRLIRETCIAIRKSLPRKLDDRRTMRYAREDALFVALEKILVESFTNSKSEHWFSMCDEALRIIFDMAEHPEKIGESIFNQMSERLLKHAVQNNNTLTQDTNGNDSPDLVFQPTSMHPSQSHTTELVHPIALARFIHFLGDLALNLAVFFELYVLLELKIRNVPDSDTSLNNVSSHNISAHNISISNRRRSRKYGSIGGANLEEEIGLGGAEAEDADMEFVGSICDEEIVCGKNLLAKLSRVVVEVVSDPFRYPQLELKQASSLALAKYMMVSAKFCHDHLRLLFTILEKTKDRGTKINLLTAISDLCIRFPNQLDGWTGRIFECLQSGEVMVRRTALKIISRLVLCDILKAKSQTSVMANLIVDNDEYIALYSRHFFVELSKKQNAIYNVLPDIISRLSDSKTGISQEHFKIVMKFIFELIDKSHHIERLVDKLCGRFMDTDDERHWEDLAYCLSLLKYSEKSMVKLFDKFECYKDKLCIDAVREHILSIITNYRKTPMLKNEIKVILDEFEAKITKARGEEEEQDANAEQPMEQDGEKQESAADTSKTDLDETVMTADETVVSRRTSMEVTPDENIKPTPAKRPRRTRR